MNAPATRERKIKRPCGQLEPPVGCCLTLPCFFVCLQIRAKGTAFRGQCDDFHTSDAKIRNAHVKQSTQCSHSAWKASAGPCPQTKHCSARFRFRFPSPGEVILSVGEIALLPARNVSPFELRMTGDNTRRCEKSTTTLCRAESKQRAAPPVPLSPRRARLVPSACCARATARGAGRKPGETKQRSGRARRRLLTAVSHSERDQPNAKRSSDSHCATIDGHRRRKPAPPPPRPAHAIVMAASFPASASSAPQSTSFPSLPDVLNWNGRPGRPRTDVMLLLWIPCGGSAGGRGAGAGGGSEEAGGGGRAAKRGGVGGRNRDWEAGAAHPRRPDAVRRRALPPVRLAFERRQLLGEL